MLRSDVVLDVRSAMDCCITTVTCADMQRGHSLEIYWIDALTDPLATIAIHTSYFARSVLRAHGLRLEGIVDTMRY